jgi:hypothetical protein
MLFDLRSKGRRRTVQLVYGGLAVLFLLGFIGFGVGGGFGGGGIFNAVNNGQNGSGASASDRVKAAQRLVVQQPNNAQAWANLARLQYELAGQGSNYNQSTDTFTASGKQALKQVKASWDRYLALAPSHPDPTLANLMANALGTGGLGDNKGAYQALQIVAASQSPPTASTYTYIAYYAYKAGYTSQGDLAAQEALKLVPAAQRSTLQAELAALKNPNSPAAQAAASAAASSNGTQVTTLPSSSTSTGSSNTTSTSSTVPAGASTAKVKPPTVSTLPASH